MVLYSKIPIRSYARNHFKSTPNRYTRISMVTPKIQTPFVFMELHATSPNSIPELTHRRVQLEEIAQVISSQNESHKILVGDLNTSTYSPYLKAFETISQLTNAMRGHSLWGTWPNFLPSLFRIPLDHVLVSDQIEVLERHVQPDLGSDHLPVISKLRIHA